MSKAIIAVALINAVAGGIVALSRAHIPAQPFWDGREAIVFVAICTVTLLPVLQTVTSERGERKLRKKAELANTLQQILAGVLILLSDDAKADWKRTGVQVFRVRRRWVFFEMQVRAAKLRLTHVAPSGVKWTKGKGLIGTCWSTRLPVSRNLAEHFSTLRDLDRSEWITSSQAIDKFGLSYEEFKRVNNKYGLVVAFPLTVSDKYVGCITVDMPPDCCVGVDSDKVLEILGAAAPSVAALMNG